MYPLVITASYTWTCQGHSKGQVSWKKIEEKAWHIWQNYFYFNLASTIFGMCISACKQFRKLLLPSDSAFVLSHVELQKLKLNVEKVLLEGLALYWNHGKGFVSLNDNGNEPGIVLFLKSMQKSKYQLPRLVIRKIQRRAIVVHPGMSRLTAWAALPSSQWNEK